MTSVFKKALVLVVAVCGGVVLGAEPAAAWYYFDGNLKQGGYSLDLGSGNTVDANGVLTLGGTSGVTLTIPVARTDVTVQLEVSNLPATCGFLKAYFSSGANDYGSVERTGETTLRQLYGNNGNDYGTYNSFTAPASGQTTFITVALGTRSGFTTYWRGSLSGAVMSNNSLKSSQGQSNTTFVIGAQKSGDFSTGMKIHSIKVYDNVRLTSVADVNAGYSWVPDATPVLAWREDFNVAKSNVTIKCNDAAVAQAGWQSVGSTKGLSIDQAIEGVSGAVGFTLISHVRNIPSTAGTMASIKVQNNNASSFDVHVRKTQTENDAAKFVPYYDTTAGDWGKTDQSVAVTGPRAVTFCHQNTSTGTGLRIDGTSVVTDTNGLRWDGYNPVAFALGSCSTAVSDAGVLTGMEVGSLFVFNSVVSNPARGMWESPIVSSLRDLRHVTLSTDTAVSESVAPLTVVADQPLTLTPSVGRKITTQAGFFANAAVQIDCSALQNTQEIICGPIYSRANITAASGTLAQGAVLEVTETGVTFVKQGHTLTWDSTQAGWVDENSQLVAAVSPNDIIQLQDGDNVTLASEISPLRVIVAENATASLSAQNYLTTEEIRIPATATLVLKSNAVLGAASVTGGGALKIAAGATAQFNGEANLPASKLASFTGRLIIAEGRLQNYTTPLNDNVSIEVLDGGQLWLNNPLIAGNAITARGHGWTGDTTVPAAGQAPLRIGANVTLAGAVTVYGTVSGETATAPNIALQSSSVLTLSGAARFPQGLTTAYEGGSIVFSTPADDEISGTVTLQAGNVTFGTGSGGTVNTAMKCGDSLVVGSGRTFTLHTWTTAAATTNETDKVRFNTAITLNNSATLSVQDGAYCIDSLSVAPAGSATVSLGWCKGWRFNMLNIPADASLTANLTGTDARLAWLCVNGGSCPGTLSVANNCSSSAADSRFVSANGVFAGGKVIFSGARKARLGMCDGNAIFKGTIQKEANAGTVFFDGAKLTDATLDGVILGGSTYVTVSGTVNISNMTANDLTGGGQHGYALAGSGTLNFSGVNNLTIQSDGTTANPNAKIGLGSGGSVVLNEGAGLTARVLMNTTQNTSNNASIEVASGATLTMTDADTWSVTPSLENAGTVIAGSMLWVETLDNAGTVNVITTNATINTAIENAGALFLKAVDAKLTVPAGTSALNVETDVEGQVVAYDATTRTYSLTPYVPPTVTLTPAAPVFLDYTNATIVATVTAEGAFDAAAATYTATVGNQSYNGTYANGSVTFEIPGSAGDSANVTLTATPEGGSAAVATTATSFVFGTAADWFESTATKFETTGDWENAEPLDGKIVLSGDANATFTPTKKMTGNTADVVWVVSFDAPNDDDLSEELVGAQTAFRLATGGFQLWVTNGSSGAWVDVAATGIEPAINTEYTITNHFDYSAPAHTLTVTVNGQPLTADSGATTTFALPSGKTKVDSFEFAGAGALTGIAGNFINTMLYVDGDGNAYATLAEIPSGKPVTALTPTNMILTVEPGLELTVPEGMTAANIKPTYNGASISGYVNVSIKNGKVTLSATDAATPSATAMTAGGIAVGNVKPGLYYWVEASTTQNFADKTVTVGTPVQATSEAAVTVAPTNPTTGKVIFYRVAVDAKKPATP